MRPCAIASFPSINVRPVTRFLQIFERLRTNLNLSSKNPVETKKASAFKEALAYIKRAMSLFTSTAEASHGPEINSSFISKVVSELHMFCHHQHQGFNSMTVSIVMNSIFILSKKIFSIT